MKKDWESATPMIIPNIELSKFSQSLNQELIPPEEVACWVIDEYKKFNLDENIFKPGGYYEVYELNGEEWNLWIGNDSLLDKNMNSMKYGVVPFFSSTLRDSEGYMYFAIGSKMDWYGQYPEGHTKEDKIDLIWYELLNHHFLDYKDKTQFSDSVEYYGDPEPEDIVKLFTITVEE